MENKKKKNELKFYLAAALLSVSCCLCVLATEDNQIASENPSQNPQTIETLTITKHQADTETLNEIEKSFSQQQSAEGNSSNFYSEIKSDIKNYYENGIKPANDFFSPVPNDTSEISIPKLRENSASQNTMTPLKDILGSDEEIPQVKQSENILTNFDDDKYVGNIEESNADLEGKTISSISVDGLKHLTEDVVINAIKTKKGYPFNTEILQKDLQNIYATGYFQDKMEINPILNEDDTVDLVFTVKENLIINDVAIMGNTVIETSELLKYVKPLKGYPQNINNINKAIEGITNCYKDNGYILGGVLNVDDDENGLLTFSITEGVINKFIIDGNEKTRDYVISRNILTQPGTVYNENYLKEDIAKIYSTNLFKDVSREIIPVEDGEVGQYDVKIVVKEASSDNVSIGVGVDSALGVFGSFGVAENNFMGKGQRVSLSGIIGSGVLLSDASIKDRVNYQAELSFFEPYFLNSDNSLLTKLYFRELGSYQVPLAIERRFGLMANVDHKVKGYEHLYTGFGLGVENIDLKEGDYKRISSLYSKRGINIANRHNELKDGTFLNFAPSIKYSDLDDYENPRNGVIAQAKFIEALSLSNIHDTNGRLAGRITKYIPVFEKSSLAFTGRAGVKAHGNNMPEIMAFSLGGPYSVRGYKMSGVGSGDGFVMGSVELATPIPFFDKIKYEFFHKMRLTFFIDAGSVFDGTISSKLYDRPMNAISGGVGLKVYIPKIGAISVDYGIPITNTGIYGPKHGYFTFGTGGMDWYGM